MDVSAVISYIQLQPVALEVQEFERDPDKGFTNCRVEVGSEKSLGDV
jgi:hypothetical protein